MRKILLFIPVIAVGLFSCQKEIDFVNGSGGGSSTGGNRLFKVVAKEGADSTVTVYTYNSSGKLINVKTTGMLNGADQSNEFRYYRNSSGIIIRVVQINPNLVMAGIDSVITQVNYNIATGKYTSDVTALSLFGFTIKDSSAHVYDAAGKLLRTDEYQSIVNLGQPYELGFKTQYAYDAAGNIRQLDFYSHDAATGMDDLVSNAKFTYDTKTAAINYGADAIAVGQPELAAVNNIIKAEITDVADPANNVVLDYTYNYNSGNRPVSGTIIQTPGGNTSILSLFYQ